jgi:DNA-binding IscR family transcriptional regulator
VALAVWRPGEAERREIVRHLRDTRVWQARLARLPLILPPEARLRSLQFNPENVSGTPDVQLVIAGEMRGGAGQGRVQQVMTFVNSLSRDSVHQLLLPLVRSGWVAAGRGRLGGYRVTPAASGASILDIVSAFSHRGATSAVPGTPGWIRRLEDRADQAYRGVLASITIEDMAGAVRAERDALTWAI